MTMQTRDKLFVRCRDSLSLFCSRIEMASTFFPVFISTYFTDRKSCVFRAEGFVPILTQVLSKINDFINKFC